MKMSEFPRRLEPQIHNCEFDLDSTVISAKVSLVLHSPKQPTGIIVHRFEFKTGDDDLLKLLRLKGVR